MRNRFRIFVEPIQLKGGTISLHDALVDRLKRDKSVEVVAGAAGADWILAGSGETYVKGYLARNHRIRYRNAEARPILGGYLSVELKDRNAETAWSNLVTPSRFAGGDIGKDLGGQIAARLVEFLNSTKGPASKP